MTRNLFIFGYGFSSREIARQAGQDFDTVFGTSRSTKKAAAFSRENVTGLVFDGEALSRETLNALETTTHLVMSIAPGDEDPVLAAMYGRLRECCPRLEWAGYLSTVGVYGDHDGEWVDEDTVPKPVSKRSRQRVAAENAWQTAAKDAGVPMAVFRLSGIYGPGRNAFMNIENGTARRLVKPGQVFNRIHREDIGQAVTKAIRLNAEGVFNITDDEPSPPQDVVTFAHELMGLKPPPETDFETADISPMARSFYGENKRVSNRKSKTVLGVEYQWPDYRTSLTRMWKEGLWRG
ncbi:MAG: SDR family oxidoreductase [Pseudomonadota bacterium]